MAAFEGDRSQILRQRRELVHLDPGVGHAEHVVVHEHASPDLGARVGPPVAAARRGARRVCHPTAGGEPCARRHVEHHQPRERHALSVLSVPAALADRHRDGQHVLGREVVERQVVGQRLRAGAPRADLVGERLLRGRRVRHVEDLEEHAVEVGEVTVVHGVVADREQMGVVEHVQVRREPRDLQLSRDARRRGVGEIEGVERVGLLERHHEGAVTVEAHGADVFRRRDVVHGAEAREGAALRGEHRDRAVRAGARRAARRGGDAEVALVLVQRELVQDAAFDQAARGVVGIRRLRPHREFVDVARVRDVGQIGEPTVLRAPLMRHGEVERVARAHHHPGAREHGGHRRRLGGQRVERDERGERLAVREGRRVEPAAERVRRVGRARVAQLGEVRSEVLRSDFLLDFRPGRCVRRDELSLGLVARVQVLTRREGHRRGGQHGVHHRADAARREERARVRDGAEQLGRRPVGDIEHGHRGARPVGRRHALVAVGALAATPPTVARGRKNDGAIGLDEELLRGPGDGHAGDLVRLFGRPRVDDAKRAAGGDVEETVVVFQEIRFVDASYLVVRLGDGRRLAPRRVWSRGRGSAAAGTRAAHGLVALVHHAAVPRRLGQGAPERGVEPSVSRLDRGVLDGALEGPAVREGDKRGRAVANGLRLARRPVFPARGREGQDGDNAQESLGSHGAW